MPTHGLMRVLAARLDEMAQSGRLKGRESVICGVVPGRDVYIYSNPITPAEAAAALKAIDVVDSPSGAALLRHLRLMVARFKAGLIRLGFKTLPGEHPIVPLLLRDTARTAALVAHLHRNNILATGSNYPVVPKGDEEIRFQISADHTPDDIDMALVALEHFG